MQHKLFIRTFALWIPLIVLSNPSIPVMALIKGPVSSSFHLPRTVQESVSTQWLALLEFPTALLALTLQTKWSFLYVDQLDLNLSQLCNSYSYKIKNIIVGLRLVLMWEFQGYVRGSNLRNKMPLKVVETLILVLDHGIHQLFMLQKKWSL